MSSKSSSKKDRGPSSSKVTDQRFANFESDPRFRLPAKGATKTKIDKRFSHMLKDADFTASARVDKYGRKLKSDNKKKALQQLYEEEGDEDEEAEVAIEVEDDRIIQRELEKADARFDPARGGGFSSSESDSESEDEEEDAEAEAEAEVSGSASMQRIRDAQNDVETGDVSKRIAVVNLDWDHIKSQDLMALFSSFVPKGGRIEKISIYPSEFGKERMQREELEGPPKEIFKTAAKADDDDESADSEDESGDDEDDDEEDDEAIKKSLIEEGNDQDFDSDALRSYQLDRLRYFYAVVVCSDTATAEKIYQATDGTEYQTSSNFMDLRFVPDDVTFDDEPRDECDHLKSDYRPTEFTTDALQHSKVKLTWDMHPEEAARKDDIKRAFTGSRSELEENDLRAYLASDSEDDANDAGEDAPVAADDEPKLSKKELAARKMREALGLSAEPSLKSSKAGPVGDMQITFSAGLTGKDNDKEPSATEETTIEKYIRKERERKARKKEKAVAKREGRDPEDEEEEAADPEEQQQDEDLGFDDPFFTTEEPVKTSKASERKEDRRRKREAKEAEAAANAAQRAQLELVMAQDSKDAGDRLDHFDMNEIVRAEKQKSKKNKKGKFKKDGEDRGGLQDGFSMNVGDDRFKAVFENHEFAIDPSNPRFKATDGMKQLLAEGRKKRPVNDSDLPTNGAKPSGKKRKADHDRDNISALVESVKKKSHHKS